MALLNKRRPEPIVSILVVVPLPFAFKVALAPNLKVVFDPITNPLLALAPKPSKKTVWVAVPVTNSTPPGVVLEIVKVLFPAHVIN